MATISLTIADANLTRVVDALCISGGWTPETGMTKNAFAKAEVARMIRERVVSVERQALRMQAEQSAAGVAEPDVT